MVKQLSKGEKRLNKVLSTIAWVFILIGLTAVTWFYMFSSTHVNTNDAQVRQYITPVSSRVPGFITQVNYEENQFVHKGDTLIVIDNREYKYAVDVAEANLKSTTQSVDTYVKAVDKEESEANVLDAKIESAKIEVWRTEQDYNRFRNLVKEDAATLQQFEEIEAKYKQSKSNLEALQQQKKTVFVSSSTEESKIKPIQSQVELNKSKVKDAKLTYSYSYLIAPYDGWVGTKNIQLGQLIKQGQALVHVVSQEKWIIANFLETQLNGIDFSKPIKIKADAFPEIEYEGKVLSLSPASGSEFALNKPNNATGNFVKIEQRFPIKIILKSSKNNDKLRSGMNVLVSAEKDKK
jgi:membrane fusion protein, multidrug efflux system